MNRRELNEEYLYSDWLFSTKFYASRLRGSGWSPGGMKQFRMQLFSGKAVMVSIPKKVMQERSTTRQAAPPAGQPRRWQPA